MPKPRPKRMPPGSLSRERVVDAALELVDTGGVETLSMPKLARHLGVGVMSLYTHIDSKDDLLDALVQRVLAQLDLPDDSADWRETLRAHFHDLRAALLAHPGLGAVLAHKNVTVPAVFDVLEANLAVLASAGLSEADCVSLYYALLTYTLGFVSWELPRTHTISEAEYGRRWRAAVDGLDAVDYPTLHAMVDTLATAASDRQFAFGLDRLVGAAAPEEADVL